MIKVIDHLCLIDNKLSTAEEKIMFEDINKFFTDLKKEHNIVIIMNNHEYPLK
jgi:hypothetical protein